MISVDNPNLLELAERFGTPFYLYDMDAALRSLREFRELLPPCAEIYYAMKANSNPLVLGAFGPEVAGLDISSVGELRLAIAAGYSAERMSFAGPGKRQAELREALAAGIGLISVESHAELRRLVGVAQEAGARVRITLRVNPDTIPKAFMMKMGGRPSQFGIAEEDIDAPLCEALNSPEIDLQGIHIYSGTQCLDEGAIVENLAQTLAINRRLVASHGFDPKVVNLGGGFGVAYFAGQEPLDNSRLAGRISKLFEEFLSEAPTFSKTRFFLELGRFLIAPFGSYVARVVEVKQTRAKRFAILDGGMNHCFPATGNFGQLVKKNYQVTNLSRAGGERQPHELVGPLCTPLDSMARGVELERVEEGDLVEFATCGAYAFSASPLLFLAHDTPPEIVLHEGAFQVGRRRLSATEFV